MASDYFDAKLICGYAKICHTGIIAINQIKVCVSSKMFISTYIPLNPQVGHQNPGTF